MKVVPTNNHSNTNPRTWGIYLCHSCGGIVTAWSNSPGGCAFGIFPEPPTLNDDIPDKPRKYLEQALSSIHAPAGAVMLAASAVDSMLKLKNYTTGNLYSRIEAAIKDHLITKEMGSWAHEVRLDANDQRHADELAELPDESDAQRVIDFARALAEFLFVLPAKVQKGLNKSE